VHNVDAQKEVCDGVGQNAGAQAARADGDPVVESTGEEGGGVIRWLMLQHKEHGNEAEGEPGKSPEGNRFEVLFHKIAEQKPAPEDFFHERHDDSDAQKPECKPPPVGQRAGGKVVGLKELASP